MKTTRVPECVAPSRLSRVTSYERAASLQLAVAAQRELPVANRQHSEHAFYRVELAAALGAVGLIALVALPMLATTKHDSQRSICANNLRLIGRGLHSWIGDHEGGYMPWWTSVSEGGTQLPGFNKPANAWFEWASLSNYLGTPKILTRPADETVLTASSFDQFVQAAYRANALSYTVALDTFPEARRVGVSTDRNLRTDAGGVSCASGTVGCDAISATSPQAGWTNGAVHGNFGHTLVTDGSVEFTSRAGIQEHFRGEFDDNGSIHLLRPR